MNVASMKRIHSCQVVFSGRHFTPCNNFILSLFGEWDAGAEVRMRVSLLPAAAKNLHRCLYLPSDDTESNISGTVLFR